MSAFDVITIRDSAAGNGTTDDAPAFKTAIAAAQAAGGGTITVDVGTYKLGSTVTIPSTVTVILQPGASFTGIGSLATSGTGAIIDQRGFAQPSFNVMAYGVKGDLTTDDTSAFQALWNAAPDFSTILIPAGCAMKITSMLTLHNKRAINLIASGCTGTAIDSGTTTAAGFYWKGAAGASAILDIQGVHSGYFANFVVMPDSGGTANRPAKGINIDHDTGTYSLTFVTSHLTFEEIAQVVTTNPGSDGGYIGYDISHVSASNCEEMTLRRCYINGGGGQPAINNNTWAVRCGSGNCKDMVLDDCSFPSCACVLTGVGQWIMYGGDHSSVRNIIYNGGGITGISWTISKLRGENVYKAFHMSGGGALSLDSVEIDLDSTGQSPVLFDLSGGNALVTTTNCSFNASGASTVFVHDASKSNKLKSVNTLWPKYPGYENFVGASQEGDFYASNSSNPSNFVQVPTIAGTAASCVLQFIDNSGVVTKAITDGDGNNGTVNRLQFGDTSKEITIGGHLVMDQGSAPTAAAGAQAGGSPPSPVVGGGSTDQRGSITFGTGTTPSAGIMATITYATAYTGGGPKVPRVWVTPTNSATAALNLYVSQHLTTQFQVSVVTAPAASQANTTYAFDYLVVS